MWPQLTLIVLSAIGVGIHLVNHGKPKDENYNIILQLIQVAIVYSILYAGGFFDVFLK